MQNFFFFLVLVFGMLKTIFSACIPLEKTGFTFCPLDTPGRERESMFALATTKNLGFFTQFQSRRQRLLGLKARMSSE